MSLGQDVSKGWLIEYPSRFSKVCKVPQLVRKEKSVVDNRI